MKKIRIYFTDFWKDLELVKKVADENNYSI